MLLGKHAVLAKPSSSHGAEDAVERAMLAWWKMRSQGICSENPPRPWQATEKKAVLGEQVRGWRRQPPRSSLTTITALPGSVSLVLPVARRLLEEGPGVAAQLGQDLPRCGVLDDSALPRAVQAGESWAAAAATLSAHAPLKREERILSSIWSVSSLTCG